MYFATGNNSYLKLATTPGIAKHAGAFWGGQDYGVFSWDNKLAGAQVILSILFVMTFLIYLLIVAILVKLHLINLILMTFCI
jgi:hypothetical protein